MLKAERLLPLDLELKVSNQVLIRREQIWLTQNQFEVLEIVAKVLDQTVSEYIKETILSMLEYEVDDIISQAQREASWAGRVETIMSSKNNHNEQLTKN